jgi:hypothetical protein
MSLCTGVHATDDTIIAIARRFIVPRRQQAPRHARDTRSARVSCARLRTRDRSAHAIERSPLCRRVRELLGG